MHARLVRSAASDSRRAPRLPALLLTGALAAGCGSSGASSNGQLAPNGSFGTEAASSPAAGGPSALPTEQLFKTVLKRYRDYQDAYKKAYETNDPGHLSDVAMDPLLGEITRDIEATKAKGQIWRFANTLNPRVYARSQDSSKVYVIDCVRTLAGYRYSATTGKRIDGGPGGAYVYRTTLQYDGGAWKAAATIRDKQC